MGGVLFFCFFSNIFILFFSTAMVGCVFFFFFQYIFILFFSTAMVGWVLFFCFFFNVFILFFSTAMVGVGFSTLGGELESYTQHHNIYFVFIKSTTVTITTVVSTIIIVIFIRVTDVSPFFSPCDAPGLSRYPHPEEGTL